METQLRGMILRNQEEEQGQSEESPTSTPFSTSMVQDGPEEEQPLLKSPRHIYPKSVGHFFFKGSKFKQRKLYTIHYHNGINLNINN